MIYPRVKCIQSGKNNQEAVDIIGALIVNKENGHGLFAPENSNNYYAFSKVKDVKDEKYKITVITKNSIWIFENYTN